MAEVRGEPDYADNVVRWEKYKTEHPETEVLYVSPHWEAVSADPCDGRTVTVRMSLGALMDTLELRDLASQQQER